MEQPANTVYSKDLLSPCLITFPPFVSSKVSVVKMAAIGQKQKYVWQNSVELDMKSTFTQIYMLVWLGQTSSKYVLTNVR